MSLQKIALNAWDQNILLTVLVELTYRCNLDCFFCYNDRNLAGTPLSTGQYFHLFEDLRDMQVLNLTLSGGEPLAHPDFFAIGAKARELGFVTRIKSNGHALNARIARRIRDEIDPFGIDISLHGATAETHDRQTRVPGSFDRLLRNLDILQALGLRFRINTTLTAWNEHELEAIYELVDSWGVRLNLGTTVTARDDGDQAPLDIAPSAAAMSATFRLQLERAAAAGNGSMPGMGDPAPDSAQSAKPSKQCGTGSSTLTIDPVGNILPCVQWRRPVGNLHRDRVSDIWSDSPELEDVRNTAIAARKLVENQGRGGRLMSYCIGEAVCQTNSPLSVYDNARRQMDSRLKILIK